MKVLMAAYETKNLGWTVLRWANFKRNQPLLERPIGRQRRIQREL